MIEPLAIVLIEDQRSLRQLMAGVLEQAGHQVVALGCAEELEDGVSGRPVDLFLLDLNLPGEDGISLARRLRSTHPAVGIIMVTALSGPEHMTQGFYSGADMYLLKPLAPDVLRAAVDALTRRLKPPAAGTGLRLHTATLHLHGPEGSAHLQEAEAALLTAFMRALEHRLETWQIGELMGQSVDTLSKSGIEVRITRLRKKLIACGAAEGCIRSLRTVGYQLCTPVAIV